MIALVSDTIKDTNKIKLKIMIIEDEEDILSLYKDYLLRKGFEIICSSSNADDFMPNFRKNHPDIALMDYRMAGHKNGIDAAIEILTEYPLFPILFITAYEQLRKDILSYPIFKDKNVLILLKPAPLPEIESAILDLVKNTIFNN